MRKYQYALWLTIVVILAGMTACGSRETELSFETIERNDTYSPEEGYGGLEPYVVLVTTRQEINQFEGLISQAALDHLAELNFEQYFAIAVFRGRQPYSGYATIIERVVRQVDKILVYAQFWEPRSNQVILTMETSPYHLIKVHRDDGVSQETELLFQSQIVTPTPPSR